MIDHICFSKLNPNAKSPTRKNPTDAGIDFYSCEFVSISPHSIHIVHTGISIQIPKNYVLLIKPKSRNDHLIGAGVVDPLYEPGEILVKVTNISKDYLEIKMGDAIAQGIYIPIETPKLLEVPIEELKNTSARSGTGGIVTQSEIE